MSRGTRRRFVKAAVGLSGSLRLGAADRKKNVLLIAVDDLRPLALQLAQIVNPDCRVIGCAINTAAMSESEAEAYLAETEAHLDLPCVDPFRHGAGRLVDAL